MNKTVNPLDKGYRRSSFLLICLLFLSILPANGFGYSPGDGNGDGAVNILDAVMALRTTVRLHDSTPEQAAALDVSPMPGTGGRPMGNGAVDVADAVLILRYAVRLVSSIGPPPPSSHIDRGSARLLGRVRTRDGAPLPDVHLSILGRPGAGDGRTRPDGTFDWSVDAGGWLTVVYRKAGFLTAQRKVNATWNEASTLPDVVLVGLDPLVTSIALSENAAVQVARGSVVADEDGTRQSTLLFPAGTTASLVMPDGSTRPAAGLSVRATEYTVGANGPQSMPAELPPTSAYTYAVEFSADEAIDAGAAEVRFSRPVINYVENFLRFPVGLKVPTGWYDRSRSVWVPSDDGRVVGIVSTAGGKAGLDVTGDGAADSGEVLSALGIDDDERGRMAALYQPGQSLWRVPIPHFTPWDHNWPYGCPDRDRDGTPDCRPPNRPRPIDSPDDEPCLSSGSILEIQNQSLGETIPLAGTPFRLAYRSHRMPGAAAGPSTLRIPLTGSNTPNGLRGAALEIIVAGRRFTPEAPPTANQAYSFTWDGRSASGGELPGPQPITVRLGYTYPLVYLTPDEFARSFAALGGVPLDANETRREVTLWSEWQGTVGNGAPDLQAAGLGGWTLDAHHLYDPVSRTLHRGDGGRVTADALSTHIITTVAGRNARFDQLGDGGPAMNAFVFSPTGVAVGPDGSLYIADSTQYRVRRIALDGTISTVAGNGVKTPGNVGAYSGDGGPATQAQLYEPTGIAFGPDGSLYIADRRNHRVRRVGTDGIITTVAGTGEQGFSGDGGPATEAKLNLPSWVAVAPDGALYITDHFNGRVRRVGTDGIISTFAGGGQPRDRVGDGGPATLASLYNPAGLAVGSDGSLYIADGEHHRIRRVAPDGIITTVAGTGSRCADPVCGDGDIATEARLTWPTGVAFGPDGTLYITDTTNRRVRRIGPDGIIRTVAGSGAECESPYAVSTCGDDGPATMGRLNMPQGIALGPDGSVYIADTLNWPHPVRRVVPAPGSMPGGETSIPSGDGSELFVFGPDGRHLRTLDPLTGGVRYTFAYDTAGRLRSVTDGDGNVTAIERDPSGSPTAVTGPYGARTLLGVNADGYLSAVTNPAGESVALEYMAGGLLTRMKDPRGNAHRFDYDDRGRLVRDEDPAGGWKTLERVQAGSRTSIVMTSAMGRTETQESETLQDDMPRRITTFPGGQQAETTRSESGMETTRYPDGTITTIDMDGDPLLGARATVPESTTITTPSGLASLTQFRREAASPAPGDPPGTRSRTDTVLINGRPYAAAYDGATRTYTMTTPEGRKSSVGLDEQGRVVRAAVGAMAPLRLGYDDRGRIGSVAQGEGEEARSIAFHYDAAGALDRAVDPLGQATSLVVDAAGRLQSQTVPDGAAFTYSYDENGNRTGITQPDGSTHQFSYTPVGLMAAYRPPPIDGAGETRYEYNLDRQLVRVVRSDGDTVVHSYDISGRRTAVTLARGAYEYGYDAAGRPASISSPDGITTTLRYDGGLLTGEAWMGAVGGEVTRKYDANFRVVSQSVNGGSPAAYRYDRDGLTTGAGGLTLTRDPQNGTVTGTTLGGVKTARSYNPFGELTGETVLFKDAPLFGVTYTRDRLGRITGMTETADGSTEITGYAYDPAGRLVEVRRNGAAAVAYAYDRNGNRLSVSGPSGTVSAETDRQDRLLRQGAATYLYTPAGDLSSRNAGGQTTTFRYDALGDLLSAVLPDGHRIDYLIDGRHRRVGKRRDGKLVQGFLYGDGGRPVAELDGAGAIVSRFVYAGRSAVPEYMVKGARTYRIISDPRGSPRRVIDSASGEVVQRIDYDAFGVVLRDTNPGFQPFGFAGGLYDRDTGLVRFGARDYDPEAGRWTAKDPTLFSGGQTNLYAYVENDPVNRVDPRGAFGVEVSGYWGIGGGVSIAHTPGGGWSAGFELGVGKGTGFEIDPNQEAYRGSNPDPLWDSQATLFGEVEGRVGPARFSGRLESVESPCPGEFSPMEWKGKACGGMVCFGESTTIRGDPGQGIKENLGKETGWGVEGKAGVKVIFPIGF